jgi:hypothetical protein
MRAAWRITEYLHYAWQISESDGSHVATLIHDVGPRPRGRGGAAPRLQRTKFIVRRKICRFEGSVNEVIQIRFGGACSTIRSSMEMLLT